LIGKKLINENNEIYSLSFLQVLFKWADKGYSIYKHPVRIGNANRPSYLPGSCSVQQGERFARKFQKHESRELPYHGAMSTAHIFNNSSDH
jgi:hypothetical protein